MPTHSFVSISHSTFAACLLVAAVLTQGSHWGALGQQATNDPDRVRAFQLFDESKFTEALPLLEKLAVANPNDPVVLERFGFALLAIAETVKDKEQRQLMFNRAREPLLRSKQLGNNSNLMKAALESLAAADRGRTTFSASKEADVAMHEGEAAYVRGDLDKAAAAYERALGFDPQLYEAPLFAGDMYFKRKEWDRSGEWFARAIQIDPNRETAYRYWGDALMMGQNKREDSRLKFVEAIVAEPYNRRAWVGLSQWSERYGIQLSHPRIEPPGGVSSLKEGKMTISIDPKILEDKSDGSSAWMLYGITRAAWAMNKFTREFPNEKDYRHSLREEAEALSSVAISVKDQMKQGKIKQIDPMIERLVKLHDEGLVEAFVLFARANQGIAKDYSEYRKTNRDKLRRYLLEYVSATR